MVRGAVVDFERWNGWPGHSVAISAAVADILGPGAWLVIRIVRTVDADVVHIRRNGRFLSGAKIISHYLIDQCLIYVHPPTRAHLNSRVSTKSPIPKPPTIGLKNQLHLQGQKRQSNLNRS